MMPMSEPHRYFEWLAAAYVRGKLLDSEVRGAHDPLFTHPLDALAEDDLEALICLGADRGLRLHRFKRTMELPRVRKVLGILKGIQPANVLDIGSGRGVFLWSLLDTFPTLPVTAADILDYRVADIQAVHDGGIGLLAAARADATALGFADRSFDVVTALEVLEHIPNVERALAEVCRVAGRFVVLSVPSKPDNNPEHIHLFDQPTLTRLLGHQGMRRVSVEHILNHMIVVARSDGG